MIIDISPSLKGLFYFLLFNVKINYMFILIYFALVLAIILALFVAVSFVLFFIYKVPYVPISSQDIKHLFAEIKLDSDKILYDLGCGDGRVMLAAYKKYQIKGIGFEINPFVFWLAKIRTFFYRQKIHIHCKNLFKQDFKNADYFFLYLIPELANEVSNKLLSEAKPNTLIISYKFPLPKLNLIKKLEFKNIFSKSNFFIYSL